MKTSSKAVRKRCSTLSAAIHTRLGSLCSSLDLPASGFIILAQGRTGSTLLQSLLDSHPRIRCDREVLGNRKREPLQYVTGMALRERALGRFWGFKAKYYQISKSITDLSGNEFMLELQQRDWKVLHLYRRNILKTAISTIIGRQRETWKYGQRDKKTSDPCYIDPKMLCDFINYRRDQNNADREFLAGVEHFPIAYEDRLENGTDSLEDLLHFLGLEAHPLKTSLRKTNGKSSVASSIANWDQLRDIAVEQVGLPMVLEVESGGKACQSTATSK